MRSGRPGVRSSFAAVTLKFDSPSYARYTRGMAGRIATLLFAALFCVANAYAQCGDGGAAVDTAIQGRVIAPGANFDRYHEVLQLDELRLVAVGYTGSTGEFKIAAQPVGTYYIVVRIDGFKEYRERFNIWSCNGIYDHFIFMDFEDEVIRPVILDFTGEVNEVVDVTELKRVYPKQVVSEFERARDERLRGEQYRARVRLEKLVLNNPDFYDARNALGSVYLEIKQFRDAEAQFNKARELRPNSAAPLVSLGSLYVQEAEASLNPETGVAAVVVPGDDLGVILDDAIDVLNSALKIKPDAAFAYYLLGIAYTRAAAYTKAEENLRKAIEIESRLRWARIALGHLYMKQNKWKEALAEFEAYLTDYKRVSNRKEVEETRNKIAARVAKESK
jgi:tetratricopeptide (TPR) repeat protein